MKILFYFLLLILVLTFPFISHAQGVPKAFEALDYSGTVNGQLIRLRLANGYIGASYIQLYIKEKNKRLKFEPDAGTPDEKNQLKFVPFPESGSGYFLLDNMQEAYNDIPAPITGYYFLNSKKLLVRLLPIKPHQHK